MSIKFHFFGKDCVIDRQLQNRANLERALGEKNFAAKKILLLNQVHGRDVVVVDCESKIYGEQGLPKADAIVTNLKNLTIGVITADCGPILFFDDEKKIIGAAHAGWRGAKAGVIASTVAEMKKLGAKKISAAIGPMVQQKSYEVSKDFFDDFLSENSANEKFFLAAAKPGKFWFDLPSYVEEKLRVEGIEQIQNRRIDTYENERDFFSFRRSSNKGEADCGRNISVIELG